VVAVFVTGLCLLPSAAFAQSNDYVGKRNTPSQPDVTTKQPTVVEAVQTPPPSGALPVTGTDALELAALGALLLAGGAVLSRANKAKPAHRKH
jgi:LPXTG-motif cell wall-anchored protein